jgi:hypothetical protein
MRLRPSVHDYELFAIGALGATLAIDIRWSDRRYHPNSTFSNENNYRNGGLRERLRLALLSYPQLGISPTINGEHLHGT